MNWTSDSREEFEDRDGIGMPYEGDPGDENDYVDEQPNEAQEGSTLYPLKPDATYTVAWNMLPTALPFPLARGQASK